MTKQVNEELFYFSCQHCNRGYTSVNRLLKHHEEAHPDEFAVAPQADDGVANYTSSLITLGLMRQVLKRSIRLGNGGNILLVYR